MSSEREAFLFGSKSNNKPQIIPKKMIDNDSDLESGKLSSSPTTPLPSYIPSSFTTPPASSSSLNTNYPNNDSLLDTSTSTTDHNNSSLSSENQSLITKELVQPKIFKQSSDSPSHLVINVGNNDDIDRPSANGNSNGTPSVKNGLGSTFGNMFPIRKWNGNQSSTPAQMPNNNNDDNNNDKSVVQFNNDKRIPNQMELIWRQLNYTVTRFDWKSVIKEKGRGFKRSRLLNSVSGSMRAGELMAIMGPSGAGKTTLIECISGRRRRGVSGDIMVTNCTKRTKLAYMAQDDAFMPCLTVYETLLFASKLRNYQRNNLCKVKLIDDTETVYNATTFPDSDLVISLPDKTYHQNLVNQIIHKLGLDQCRDVRAENCSGGQQKRLCIALELIHSPSILILDEPTSGLDSVSCLQCVKLLRNLAHNPEQPMAIAASIHQPTARILQNFDRLYVLASNGQCMYDGPTDQLVPYLAKHKLTCPTYHNPADFVLEVASGDYGQEVVKKLIAAQCAQHQHGCLIRYSDSVLEKKDDDNAEDDEDDSMIVAAEEVRLWPETKTNTESITKICQRSRKQVKRREFYKTFILWMRCMLLAVRDPTEYLLRIFSCVSIILLNVVLYNDSSIGRADGCAQDSMMHLIEALRSDYDGNQTFSITNSLLEGPGAMAILNFGYIFFAMTFISFLTMMPVILTFPLEVGVFYKEYFNGWYSFSSYFLAKNLTNLIPTLLLPILFGATTYLITHQIWEPWRFFYFIALLVMISLVADGVGITISAVFVHNINAASIFAATSQIPMLLFTGLLVQIENLPRFIQPLTYLSYYRLFFESAIITIYGHGRCPKPEPFDLKKLRKILGDDVEEVMDCVWQNTNFFESSENGSSLSERLERLLTQAQNQNPSLIMQNFKLKDEDLNFLMICLGAYALISRIVAYIVLYRKANSRR